MEQVNGFIGMIGEYCGRIVENAKKTVIEAREVVESFLNAREKLVKTIVEIIRDSETLFIYGALATYFLEFVAIIRSSIANALSGLISLSNAVNRIALETILYGVLFDAMRLKTFRECAEDTVKDNKMRHFKKVIKELDKLCLENCETSAEIAGLISDLSKEKKFTLSFSIVVNTLCKCSVIRKETKNNLETLYSLFSRYIHRPTPNLTDVGLRIESDENLEWTKLETNMKLIKDQITNTTKTVETAAKLIADYIEYIKQN